MAASTCLQEENQQQQQQHPNQHHQQQQGEPFLPPGFRFHPTDEELVGYYLTKKVLDGSFAVRAIAEVDLNKCEPWDLPGAISSHTCVFAHAIVCMFFHMRETGFGA